MDKYRNHSQNYTREGQISGSRTNMLLTVMAVVFLCCFGFIFKECCPVVDNYIQNLKQQFSQNSKQPDNSSSSKPADSVKATAKKSDETKQEEPIKKEIITDNKIDFSENSANNNVAVASESETTSVDIAVASESETVSIDVAIASGTGIASVSVDVAPETEIASADVAVASEINIASESNLPVSNDNISSATVEACSEVVNASTVFEIASETQTASFTLEVVSENTQEAIPDKNAVENNYLPCFTTLDKQYICPVSLTEIMRIDPETKATVSIKANSIDGADFEKIRQYNVGNTTKKFTVMENEQEQPGFKVFFSNKSNSPQRLLWEVKKEKEAIFLIHHSLKGDTTYKIELAGNTYLVYEDDVILFAQLQCYTTKDVLEIQKFNYPCSKSMFISYKDKKVEKQLIYSPAVMILDNVEIDLRQVLFLELLRLEEKHELKDVLSKSKFETDNESVGTVVVNNMLVCQFFDKNFGEHLLSFYDTSLGDRKLNLIIRSITLGDGSRAYISTDMEKKQYPVVKFLPLPKGFQIRFFNNRYIGVMSFDNGEVAFRNDSGKVKYKFQAKENDKNNYLITNMIKKDLLGRCVTSEKNTQENTFYCEYSYFTGNDSWETVGSFSATDVKKNCRYMSAVPNVLLFRDYNYEINYCIFNECRLYALEHPEQ